LIKKDAETAQPKVKVYRDEEGRGKGDALVHYYRPESVDIALKILDESQIRPGFPIKVQRAVFQPGGGGTEKKKKKKKVSSKTKLYDQAKELTWAEDENRHVVIKHVFDQRESWSDPNFFKDLEQEITTECEKIGPVEKIKFFERNPEGVVVIKFEDHFLAEKCIAKMNGRFFAGRRLEADLYDGWTNYEVKESEEQRQERMKAFGSWLEDDDEEDEKKKT